MSVNEEEIKRRQNKKTWNIGKRKKKDFFLEENKKYLVMKLKVFREKNILQQVVKIFFFLKEKGTGNREERQILRWKWERGTRNSCWFIKFSLLIG